MKLEITETVWQLLEKAASRFDLSPEEIIRKSLVAYRRGRIASVRQKRFHPHCRDRSEARSISIPDLSLPDGLSATLLNEILLSYLQYHLAKPERKWAPLRISEDDANALYLDSGNSAGTFEAIAALLLL